MRSRPSILVLAAIVMFVAAVPRAEAGCGCEKAPPPPASFRPAFASPGDTVTLFAPSLVEGGAYVVNFGAPEGVAVMAMAVARRDLADGVVKPQLLVEAPELPPGPTSMVVTQLGGGTVLEVPGSSFTILQAPVHLSNENANLRARCYRAAVNADGVAYFPLDITGIVDRMIFSGVGKGGFPLHFNADDVVIYNTQGVLMQLLGPDAAGIYSIEDGDDEPSENSEERGPSSFRLTYDRHEFLTYQTLHTTNPNYLLDPDDPNWHVDGTRHIDHFHLVVAIHGLLKNGSPATPPSQGPFVLRLQTAIADHPNGHVADMRIDWSDECGEAPPDDTTTTTTTLPPGGPACENCDGGAGVCGAPALAACEGIRVPAVVGRGLAKGCRILDQADGAGAPRRRRLMSKLGRMLDRADARLNRPGVSRKMSAECLTAIEAALDQLRDATAGVP